MNKFVLFAAVVAVASASDFFDGGLFGGNRGGHGGFGGGFDPSFGQSFFGQDRVRDGNRFGVSIAQRLRDSANAKDAERDRAAIAAENKSAARVGAKNKFAEEDYVNAANQDSVQFAHDVRKAKNQRKYMCLNLITFILISMIVRFCKQNCMPQ